MNEHKRIKSKFIWIPMDKRKDRLGQPLPPRKPELRKPIFWLNRDGNELYFVNNSDEILDIVSASTGGIQVWGDEIITVSTKSGYTYSNVEPQEAVKIESFNPFHDLDYILQVEIFVRSIEHGSKVIKSPPKKGGVGEVILLWNTGEEGSYVSIRNLTPSS